MGGLFCGVFVGTQVRDRLEQFAQDYLSEEVPTVEDAYAGARDIVAEVVSEDADPRKRVREQTFDQGRLAESEATMRSVGRLMGTYSPLDGVWTLVEE